MTTMRIKRVTETVYTVRHYDRVASVDLGEMSGEALLAHLTTRHLMSGKPVEVIDQLEVGDEITVHFCIN
jgi:hypothetical protein